ncbi:TPA: CDP-glycerol glycerophosphotransferase family protein [Vibrio cholerae]|nr:CDP-glycerol glycerophosphotransferase family protein [Vibrio cholerae]HEQ3579748.1 CDP-glycerol glycerophosphotransferase family protein [Vibrio cholerae]
MKRSYRNKLFFVIRTFIDPLFKKRDDRVVFFCSTGSIDPNIQCIANYLSCFYPEKNIKIMVGKTKYDIRSYLSNIHALFTSYFVIVDHAIPRFITGKKRKIFNVWHGIPLKTIRHLDEKRFTSEFLDFESKNISGLVCSSELDRAVMAACFNVPPSKCILSGLPRADILAAGELGWFNDPQEQELIMSLHGKKLVAWMPTYRGSWHERNLVKGFTEQDELRLCEILKKNNAVFGIRPHKFSRLQSFPLLEKEGLLVDLSRYSVANTILKHTKHLITDYSSVWLDFSLISNSISLYLFDYQDYDIERGMIYPLDEVFPGRISYQSEHLLADIEDKLCSKAVSFTPSKLFFKYNDNQNTKRFVQAMFNEE